MDLDKRNGHLISIHITYKQYPPGSKSVALQLGVHLILLYFIRISLLSAETFFLFWLMVGGGWWVVGGGGVQTHFSDQP